MSDSLILVKGSLYQIPYNRAQWNNDSLFFILEYLKSTIMETKFYKLWHVYSNPNDLAVCPYLSLVKNVLQRPYKLKRKCKLLSVEHQYDHFIQGFSYNKKLSTRYINTF